jgi:hypothetical protein
LATTAFVARELVASGDRLEIAMKPTDQSRNRGMVVPSLASLSPSASTIVSPHRESDTMYPLDLRECEPGARNEHGDTHADFRMPEGAGLR